MSLVNNVSHRPSRLEVKNKDTNEKYHLDYARWAVSSSQNYKYYNWAERLKINKKFYEGDQWINNEDLETFLKDASGQTRNRIQVIHNQIRPMVEQYRGNAIRLSVNGTASAISPMAKNRREEVLSKKLLKTEISEILPALGKILQEQDPTIGGTPGETEEIFNNLYVDEYVENINELINYMEQVNKLQNTKVRLAQSLALGGIGVMKCFNHGGHRRYKVLEPEDFLFDTDAREFDLTDASFMGERIPMDPAAIFEKYQNIHPEVRKIIENHSAFDSNGETYSDSFSTREHTTNRIPVYEIYWKDVQKFEYGYVKDEYGYDSLEKINYTYPGEEKPRYTDEDLIEPPKTNKNKNLFKGKMKRNMVLDIVRFCAFIPSEYISAKNGTKEKVSDIVLDYGTLEYQDVDHVDLSNVKFPYKAYCWGYVDGNVFSPIDDAINPQRFINRIMSVFESQINNSGGAGLVIDESAIDPNSKDDIYHDMNEGRAVSINTKGKGVPNAVGHYDNTPKSGTYGMLEVIPFMRDMIQSTTGVNEALRGESTGSDQLVGVTQMLIQRGSLMQEPFYEALAQIYTQVYQDMASVGKLFYIDNERELAIATGDDGVSTFKLTKELKGEDFRVFVNRDNDDLMLKNSANQTLSFLLESQMIDEGTFANLYGRSTPDQVYRALRDTARLKKELQRRQAEADAQAQEQEMQQQQDLIAQEQQAQQEAFAQQEAADARKEMGRNQHELAKIQAQNQGKIMQEMVKTNQNRT